MTQHGNPLRRQSIVDAVRALFMYGRESEQYKRAIRWLVQSGDHKYVQSATPDQVQEIRASLGIQPWEAA